MFGKTASLMELSHWLRAGLLPRRGHSVMKFRAADLPEAFLL
jgi:hypothetical protein